MKIVSPYRPFPPETSTHEKPFDWVGALQMLETSIARTAPCPFFALTDSDTALPVPAHRYATSESRLMVWLIDVFLAYVASDDFDQDTVMISPDMLICRPLHKVWRQPFDLGLLIRGEKKFFAKRPLLNGVHFWRHAAKDRLVGFFRAALRQVRALSPELLAWGGDTEAVLALVQPIRPYGTVDRQGVSVGMLQASTILQSVNQESIERLTAATRMPLPPTPILDFRYRRKAVMRQTFEALVWPPRVKAHV